MRFQFLGGRRAGRLPSVLREHLSGSRMLLSSLRGFTKWIQRSADPEPYASKFLGAGRQRIIGQPSVDVVGSGWSEGKRMSVRATRKVGHPCRVWEFG